MGKDRASCGNHEELARTTDFRLTRCNCGTVHLHMSKGGVTVQLSDTMLAELVNVATAAQRKVESLVVDPARLPSSSAPSN
jgi:hypothetical protein